MQHPMPSPGTKAFQGMSRFEIAESRRQKCCPFVLSDDDESVSRVPCRSSCEVAVKSLGKKTGYGLRNYDELGMQRVKRISGNTMKSPKLPQQKRNIGQISLRLTG
jgi:hypothetical protein